MMNHQARQKLKKGDEKEEEKMEMVELLVLEWKELIEPCEDVGEIMER
jgi:hypothetical protein